MTAPDLGSSSGRRLAVAFTFDFDCESPWIGADGSSTPSALSRGSYGAREGIHRVLALLAKYNLPATFFIPGDTADRHPDEVKEVAAAGYEIGHHGYCHEPPTTLDLAAERTMIERGLDALDRQVGVRPVGYRSPSWELSPNTFNLLEEYGFGYDASQLGADRPYWVVDESVQDRDARAATRRNLVEVPGAWELTDSSHFMFAYFPSYRVGLASPSKVEEIWRDDFDGLLAEGSDACCVLTMHPQIIGRPRRMQMLERLINHILGHDGLWITTMGAIAAEFRTRQEAS